MGLNFDAGKPAEKNVQVSYEFKNIDIIASNCKYISGVNPLDSNDIPVINSNSAASSINSAVQTNPGPAGFIGLHVANFLPPMPNNVSYPSSQNSYRCTDFYIYNNKTGNKNSVVHDIDGSIGELVIKHKPLVSTGIFLYLCFPLKKNTKENAQPNEVDNIINFVVSSQDSAGVLSTSVSFCIPSQNQALQYNIGTGDIVIVFKDPILINKTSQDLLSQFDSLGPDANNKIPTWFIKDPSPSVKLVTENITVGGDDNIYMECVPTGMSAEDIKAYTVPINSQYTNDAGKIEFMSSTIRLSFLVFFVLIIYALFPTILGRIYQRVTRGIDPARDDMRIELDKIELWYYIYLMLIFIISISLGMAFNFDSTHISMALVTVLTFVLTSTMILFYRTSKDPNHYAFKQLIDQFNLPDILGYSLFIFGNPGDMFGYFIENKWYLLFVALALTLIINIIIIVIQHRGKLPSSINNDTKSPSSDPNVMNILELLDIIFGDIFALIAVRVIYIISAP